MAFWPKSQVGGASTLPWTGAVYEESFGPLSDRADLIRPLGMDRIMPGAKAP
jgi:hypothetical protein